jgi:hypothetical protein
LTTEEYENRKKKENPAIFWLPSGPKCRNLMISYIFYKPGVFGPLKKERKFVGVEIYFFGSLSDENSPPIETLGQKWEKKLVKIARVLYLVFGM